VEIANEGKKDAAPQPEPAPEAQQKSRHQIYADGGFHKEPREKLDLRKI
jgi:hypothetical protein